MFHFGLWIGLVSHNCSLLDYCTPSVQGNTHIPFWLILVIHFQIGAPSSFTCFLLNALSLICVLKVYTCQLDINWTWLALYYGCLRLLFSCHCMLYFLLHPMPSVMTLASTLTMGTTIHLLVLVKLILGFNVFLPSLPF